MSPPGAFSRFVRYARLRSVVGLLFGEAEIAVFQDVEVFVRHQHRNGVVLFDDGEKEFEVGISLGFRQAFGGFRPDVHSFAFLLGELFDEIVGYQHYCYDCNYADGEKYQASCALGVVDGYSCHFRCFFDVFALP